MRLKKLSKKLFVFLVVAFALTGSNAFALGMLDNVSIASAFKSGVISLEVVTTGIISMGATLTALGIVFGWLRK